MASICRGKSSWPELVGKNGEAAAAKIEAENHRVKAIVMPEGGPATSDFKCNRVRVLVDHNGSVTQTPKIG